LLGSVAEKVLRATTSPLLLVRGGDSENLEPERALRAVIVPLDGSAQTPSPDYSWLSK